MAALEHAGLADNAGVVELEVTPADVSKACATVAGFKAKAEAVSGGALTFEAASRRALPEPPLHLLSAWCGIFRR